MTDRQIELSERYLQGEATPEEVRALLRELEADEKFFEEFKHEWETHWLLKTNAHAHAQDESYVKRVIHYVHATEDKEGFLQSVKARIQDSPRRHRRLWPGFAMAGAAAVLILGVLVALSTNKPTTPTGTEPPTVAVAATVKSSQTGVTVKRASASLVVQAGGEIQVGDRVLAAADKPVLQREDGTTFQLNASAEMDFTSTETPNTATLLAGSIFVTAAQQKPRVPLIIRTPTGVRAEVVGTRFEVAIEGEKTLLRVEEGSVRFGQVNATVLVPAGKMSEVSAAGTPATPSPFSGAVAGWRNGTAPQSKRTGNLLANPGFEAELEHWTVEPAQVKGTACVIDQREPSDPRKGKVLKAPNAGSFLLGQAVPCVGGVKYRARATIHTVAGSFTLKLHFLDEKGEMLRIQQFEKSRPGEQREIGGEVVAPEGSVSVRFEVEASNAVGFIDTCVLTADE